MKNLNEIQCDEHVSKLIKFYENSQNYQKIQIMYLLSYLARHKKITYNLSIFN